MHIISSGGSPVIVIGSILMAKMIEPRRSGIERLQRINRKLEKQERSETNETSEVYS
jgi:hypothetical protein